MLEPCLLGWVYGYHEVFGSEADLVFGLGEVIPVRPAVEGTHVLEIILRRCLYGLLLLGGRGLIVLTRVLSGVRGSTVIGGARGVGRTSTSIASL